MNTVGFGDRADHIGRLALFFAFHIFSVGPTVRIASPLLFVLRPIGLALRGGLFTSGGSPHTVCWTSGSPQFFSWVVRIQLCELSKDLFRPLVCDSRNDNFQFNILIAPDFRIDH